MLYSNHFNTIVYLSHASSIIIAGFFTYPVQFSDILTAIAYCQRCYRFLIKTSGFKARYLQTVVKQNYRALTGHNRTCQIMVLNEKKETIEQTAILLTVTEKHECLLFIKTMRSLSRGNRCLLGYWHLGSVDCLFLPTFHQNAGVYEDVRLQFLAVSCLLLITPSTLNKITIA